MGGHKNLDAVFRKAYHYFRHKAYQSGVQAGFGFVPEKTALIQQGSRGDEAGES